MFLKYEETGVGIFSPADKLVKSEPWRFVHWHLFERLRLPITFPLLLHPELTCPNTDTQGRGRTLPYLEFPLKRSLGLQVKASLCGFTKRMQYLQAINSVIYCLCKCCCMKTAFEPVFCNTGRHKVSACSPKALRLSKVIFLAELIWIKSSLGVKPKKKTSSNVWWVLVEY